MASRHFVLYVHSPVFLWLISTQIFAHLYQHQACWYLQELQDFCLDMQVHQPLCCWCSAQCLFHSNNGILNILGGRSVTSNDLRFRSVTSNRNSWKGIYKLDYRALFTFLWPVGWREQYFVLKFLTFKRCFWNRCIFEIKLKKLPFVNEHFNTFYRGTS